MDQKLRAGWVAEETFKEHLKLFPMPCIDLLIDVVGRGIVWPRRIIPPMKGQLAVFGVRVLRTDSNWQSLVKRVALEEAGLEIEPNKLSFVDQELEKFDEVLDGVDRLDLATCYALTIEDEKLLQPNPSHYFPELTITYEIPPDAGKMYQRYARRYLELKSTKMSIPHQE